MWGVVFFCAWSAFVGMTCGGLVWFWCRDWWVPQIGVWRSRALLAEERLGRWEELRRSLHVPEVRRVMFDQEREGA